MNNNLVELSIVMPCLNEEKTLKTCINKARLFCTTQGISFEIIVADNGSNDNSCLIAENEDNVKLVSAKNKGYGAALDAGIMNACGRFIIIGDSDCSYDFFKLEPFLALLRADYQLVVGNRFDGLIMDEAMPWLHRYIGNPVLSHICSFLFTNKVRDYHCGLRGFSKELYINTRPFSNGMEFATEHIIKAVLINARICETPIVLHKDGRDRKSHLNTWSDGFRHLRVIMYYMLKKYMNYEMSYIKPED